MAFHGFVEANMRTAFLVIGSISISLAALFHMYAFFLESVVWLKPKTWKTFGLASQEHAEIIHPMAFNQGFYNLFLGLGAVVGLAFLGINTTIGLTLIVFTASCMIGAGTVLFFSTKTSQRAALIQAGLPLFGIVLVLIGRAL